jgi:hypothetical protein
MTDTNFGSGFIAVLPYVIAVVYWLGCGLAAAIIAGRKDRSRVGFFLLGLFFLGPLAVGVAILATPRDPVEPRRPGKGRFAELIQPSAELPEWQREPAGKSGDRP